MEVSGVSSGGAKLIVWAAVPVPFATLAVTLRFISRKMQRQVGLDDWLMLFALIVYYGLYVSYICFATAGKVGFPQNEFSRIQLEEFFKILFVVQILYGIAAPATKMAILLFYRRVFTISRWFLSLTARAAMLVVIWCITVELTVIFQCTPVGTFWAMGQHRSCINPQKFFKASGISSLLLDAIVLCIPVPIIWQLEMSIQRKLSLYSVFALGLFACAAGVLRLSTPWKQDSDDITAVLAFPSIWTSVELGTGIVCGCLPTMPILFHKVARNINSRGPSREKLDQPRDPSLPRIRRPLRDEGQTSDFSISLIPDVGLESLAIADRAPLKVSPQSSHVIDVRTELTVSHGEAKQT